jgi:hypothetical protein
MRSHTDTEISQFSALLSYFDQDLAMQCRAQGCAHCAGRLHRACYRRKPRGGGPQCSENYRWRWSFCCAEQACRRRTTPVSLRFLGRRVYLGAVVALAACMQQGLSDRRVAALKLVLEVPRRTLQRWRLWWQEVFVRTAFWQGARARLMPPVDEQQLPLSLFERFAGAELAQQLWRLLNFISPLSTRGSASTLSEQR